MNRDEDDLEKSLNELDARMAQMLGGGNRGVGSVKVNIAAGGVGVWISATAAILCLFATLVLTLLYVDQRREIDDLGDYLNAIYQQAPHLKPKDYEE